MIFYDGIWLNQFSGEEFGLHEGNDDYVSLVANIDHVAQGGTLETCPAMKQRDLRGGCFHITADN